MTGSELSAKEARRELYDVMRTDWSFEEKAREALELGKEYLGADNGHLARVDGETNHWETVVSTDGPEGQFPPGLELDLETTYCRRTVAADGPVAVHDAPAQGWADDPAFRTHGLHCYHGTTILLDDDPYGTVCFVATDPRDGAFSDGETMYAELVARLLERELERERHEAELTRRTNLVHVLNRVLRHNLRNDMTVIRGRARLMSERLRDDANGDVALRKIDELIALSEKARQLENVIGQELERRHTDVVALVERVVERVRSDFPSASITLDCEDEVTADVLPSFERAVHEVVENAAKHSGEAATVGITVENVPNAVEVRVVDDGPGLSDQEREVLKTGAETPLVHGSGLGLWLVHWIVTSHGGTVAASATEEGTTMTVSVPRSVDTGVQQQVAELRQARDRYQAAFEDAFEGMVIIDDDARIVEANPEASNVYGLDRQDLLGRSIPEFLPDDFDFETVWTEFKEAGRLRDTVTVEGADGVDRQIQYSAVVDVVPGQHLIVGRDVTEQAERERQLARAETVFHQTQDAIFLVDVTDDREFRVERVNEVYEALTGLSNAEIQGKAPREIVGDEIGTEIEARYSECVRRRETIEYQEEIPVDGEMRYWETKLSPVVEDGTVVNLVGAMRDVTDRVRRESELDVKTQAMDNAPVGVTLTDPDQDDNPIVYANDRFCELTGYEKDEVLGRNCRFLQGERTSADRVAEIRRAIDADEPVSVVLRNYRKDGTEFWNRLSVAPVEDEHGSVTHYVGFQEDVTERIERQRLFEALSNEFPDLCFVVDEECVVREVLSSSTSDGTLYVEPAAFLDESVRDVLPEEQADLLASKVEATIETGRPRTFEYELDVPVGRRLFEARMAPLSLEVDARRTVSCVVRDVTDRRERADDVPAG